MNVITRVKTTVDFVRVKISVVYKRDTATGNLGLYKYRLLGSELSFITSFEECQRKQ